MAEEEGKSPDIETRKSTESQSQKLELPLQELWEQLSNLKVSTRGGFYTHIGAEEWSLVWAQDGIFELKITVLSHVL